MNDGGAEEMRSCTKCGTMYPRTRKYFGARLRGRCRRCERGWTLEHWQEVLQNWRPGQRKARTQGEWCICEVCGTEFWVFASTLAAGWGSCCKLACRDVKSTGQPNAGVAAGYAEKRLAAGFTPEGLRRLLADEGLSLAEAAVQLGYGQHTVWMWAQKWGLTPAKDADIAAVVSKRKGAGRKNWSEAAEQHAAARTAERNRRLWADPEYKARVSAKISAASEARWAERRMPPAQVKLHKNIARQIYRDLKTRKGGRSWELLVGYTLAALVLWLRSQFRGCMSWENYGRAWHIHHIWPASKCNFDTPDDPEFKRCWALSNLRPMWAKANIRKGAKWNGQTRLAL